MSVQGNLLCLVWIGGLLLAWCLGQDRQPWQWILLLLGVAVSSGLAAGFVPRYWRRGPKSGFWLALGLIVLLAWGYYQWRQPQPNPQDISRLLSSQDYALPAIATGELISEGKSTAKGNLQFWMRTALVKPDQDPRFRPVTGRVYLTLPRDVGENLTACRKIRVTGKLYQPRSGAGIGGWNFRDYLASQGVFAGFQGEKVESLGQGFCTLAYLRQQIVKAQSAWLPHTTEGYSPEGLLISSMVLGQKAVNLPYAIRELFAQVGLSHLLAASGFQVSLLVGSTLSITRQLPRKLRFGLGLSVLVLYLGLTGLQASVARAGLMWFGILLGDCLERRVKPLGALLVAATILLMINPLWIGDLGFQLSFLATFGILVTSPYFASQLTFLPPKIADLLAVPLGATLWTLPLLLYQFSQFVWIAIPLNILASPLVEIISFGGMISAIAALIIPVAGSAIAWVLYFPTHWLIGLAKTFQTVPFFAMGIVVGQVSGIWLAVTYGVMFLLWLKPTWQKYKGWVMLCLVSALVIPLIYQSLTLVQVTILESKKHPILVIQNRQQTIVINDQKPDTQKYLLTPFLAKAGINQITCDIDITKTNLSACQNTRWLSQDPPLLEVTVARSVWWILGAADQPLPPALTAQIPPQTFVWAGYLSDLSWLERLKPPTAIAVTPYVSQRLRERLKKQGIQVLFTGEKGFIQWQPQGFLPLSAPQDNLTVF